MYSRNNPTLYSYAPSFCLPRAQLCEPLHAEAWAEAPQVEGDGLALGLEEAPPSLGLLFLAQVNLDKSIVTIKQG